MNAYAFLSRLRHSSIRRRAGVLLLVLVWGSVVMAGEVHDAAKSGELAKVKELVKASPDLVFSKDNEGATPLLVAVKSGHRDVAAFLLANKAEVNTKYKDETFSGNGYSGIKLGGTPLHCALVKGDKEMVTLLLSNKADVNIKDGIGQTPLHGAAWVGNKEMAELLLACKADANASSRA